MSPLYRICKFGWRNFLSAAILIVCFNAQAEMRRKLRWPLPKSTRAPNSSLNPRLSEYRSYLQSLSASERAEFAQDAQISFGPLGVNPKRILVKFKSVQTRSVITESLQNTSVVKTLKNSDISVMQIQAGKNNVELLAHLGALKELEGVEYAEPDYLVKAIGNPNDPQLGRQWAHSKIGSSTAWDDTTGSKLVSVGIIDTGLDFNHPDLKENIGINTGETGTDNNGKDRASNGVDDDSNGYIDDFRGWDFIQNDNNPTDENGHGTHVAGIIGAVGNNSVGIAGVNWTVSLVPIRFLNKDGYGTTSDAILALEYATSLKLPITNNSWGGGPYSKALADSIQKNSESGALFISAAGNSRTDNDLLPFYPSSYTSPGVISVAATDQKDQLSSFSNFGARSVHLAAPGSGILSTTKGSYESWSGTSMACPHVAGAAALLKSRWPNYSNLEIKNKILESVDLIGSTAAKTVSGGRLNVARALTGSKQPLPAPPPVGYGPADPPQIEPGTQILGLKGVLDGRRGNGPYGGWICQLNLRNSLMIKVYAGTPGKKKARFIGEYIANTAEDTGVSKACSQKSNFYRGSRRFSIPNSAFTSADKNKTVYVFGVSLDGTTEKELVFGQAPGFSNRIP